MVEGSYPWYLLTHCQKVQFLNVGANYYFVYTIDKRTMRAANIVILVSLVPLAFNMMINNTGSLGGIFYNTDTAALVSENAETDVFRSKQVLLGCYQFGSEPRMQACCNYYSYEKWQAMISDTAEQTLVKYCLNTSNAGPVPEIGNLCKSKEESGDKLVEELDDGDNGLVCKNGTYKLAPATLGESCGGNVPKLFNRLCTGEYNCEVDNTSEGIEGIALDAGTCLYPPAGYGESCGGDARYARQCKNNFLWFDLVCHSDNDDISRQGKCITRFEEKQAQCGRWNLWCRLKSLLFHSPRPHLESQQNYDQ